MIRIYENGMKVLGVEKMFRAPKNFPCFVVTKDTETGKEKLPALCECGGGANIVGEQCIGNARIITDSRFAPKQPWYIVKNPKVNGDHAAFILRQRDHIIEVFLDKGTLLVAIYEVVDILEQGQAFVADTIVLGTREDDTWTPYAPKHAALAVEAAIQKAATTHCLDPFFVKEFKTRSQRPMQEVRA